MTTGYTAGIAKGISFEKYVMTGARAFGALVMMRDEPFDKEIPKSLDPSSYCQEKLTEVETRLAKLQKMRYKDADHEAEIEYNEEVNRQREGIASNNKTRSLYQAMLSKVKAWQPPSPDHEGLKNFMIQQIKESIK